MQDYLPYIVSVLCALISGISSYVIARKQVKNDIKIIVKQHEVDFEAKFSSSLLTEVMKMPEIRQQISQGIKKGKR